MKTDEPSRPKGECIAFGVNKPPNISGGQLVDGVALLEIIFPKKCRPTLRWLRDQQELNRVPFRKIGRLVFFDPDEVREAWRARFTVGQKNGGAR